MAAQLGAAAAVPSYGLLIEFALFTLASQKLLYVASYDKDYPQNLKAKMEKRLPLPVAILLPQHASLAKGLDSYAVLRLSLSWVPPPPPRQRASSPVQAVVPDRVKVRSSVRIFHSQTS